jgi:uncharacterized membrane protein
MVAVGHVVDHSSIAAGMLVNGLFALILIFIFFRVNYKKELAEAV